MKPRARYSFRFALGDRVRYKGPRSGEIHTVTGIYLGFNDRRYRNGTRGMVLFYELDDEPGTSADEDDIELLED
jgi:hypothetical protein